MALGLTRMLLLWVRLFNMFEVEGTPVRQKVASGLADLRLHQATVWSALRSTQKSCKNRSRLSQANRPLIGRHQGR